MIMHKTNDQKPDYLILINGEHCLPEGYENTVELICAKNAAGSQYRLEKKTYEAFLRLREDLLKNDGIQVELISAYRTIKEQRAFFENYLNKFGLEYANKYVAKPGCSEHHTGLAIDVGIMVNGNILYTIEDLLAVDHLFKIVQEKLPRYGFILRYPRGKESFTKIGYEAWHFRYIDSPEIAKEITDNGLCFEEYWENQ